MVAFGFILAAASIVVMAVLFDRTWYPAVRWVLDRPKP